MTRMLMLLTLIVNCPGVLTLGSSTVWSAYWTKKNISNEKNAQQFSKLQMLKRNHKCFWSCDTSDEIWTSTSTRELITQRILKSCLACFQVDVQDISSSDIDGQQLMKLDRQELTVEILMVQMLMAHYCWSTFYSPWLDGPLLMINSRQSTVDHKL